jgi:methyltransferase (TIGR00027 family)
MVTVADTAFCVAVVRDEESSFPPSERLFDDPYAPLFRPSDAQTTEATERILAMPFCREGIRLRTKCIDDSVRESLRAGLTQLVVVGAGFDVRGLRLPEVAEHDATVFEVDFAEQLERKRALLAAGGVSLPPRIFHVACDLTAAAFESALSAGLAAHGFRAGAGAIFVWEGVISYIGLDAIDRTLRFMARAGGRESRVTFDFADALFEPGTAAGHAQRAGFSAFEQVGYDELWRRYALSGEPHPYASALRVGTAIA